MKIKSEIVWAVVLLGTAVGAYYFGAQAGTIQTEEALENVIQEKVEEITVLENRLQQLSEELKSRGIYSYPQASIVSEKDNSAATVLITLNGKDPLNDLRIERKKRIPTSGSSNTSGTAEKGTTSFVGTLTAHNPVAFDLEEFQKEMAINLTFKSGKNQWRQYLRMRKTPQGEIKTFWVITNGESEVIDKHIDEGFPVDEDGNLNFGRNYQFKYSDIKMNSVFDPDKSSE